MVVEQEVVLLNCEEELRGTNARRKSDKRRSILSKYKGVVLVLQGLFITFCNLKH